MLASAIASATTNLRIALAAVIYPLRHPLLLAKQLATLDLLSEGRLVVQPTVSWHEQEYEALGVPFHRRGAILDEQLDAMATAWRDTPATLAGEHFSFADVYLEPKPFRPEGPRMWFGGQSLHPALLRRLVRYGCGFHPFGSPTAAELEQLRAALAEAGRDAAELELVGGIRGAFADETSTADLARAADAIPGQIAQGYTSICFKPSMFTDDVNEVGPLCREFVARILGLLDTCHEAGPRLRLRRGFGTSSTLAAARSTAARSCASSARGPLRWLSGAESGVVRCRCAGRSSARSRPGRSRGRRTTSSRLRGSQEAAVADSAATSMRDPRSARGSHRRRSIMRPSGS